MSGRRGQRHLLGSQCSLITRVARTIIHLDMDCFYAAIEVRDKPELAGKPVAVGGARDRRGVLTTCNYEEIWSSFRDADFSSVAVLSGAHCYADPI
jgi:DNA polymerase IV